MAEKAYKVMEIAKALRVNRKTITHEIERGRLKCYRVSRGIRISETALQQPTEPASTGETVLRQPREEAAHQLASDRIRARLDRRATTAWSLAGCPP